MFALHPHSELLMGRALEKQPRGRKQLLHIMDTQMKC